MSLLFGKINKINKLLAKLTKGKTGKTLIESEIEREIFQRISVKFRKSL